MRKNQNSSTRGILRRILCAASSTSPTRTSPKRGHGTSPSQVSPTKCPTYPKHRTSNQPDTTNTRSAGLSHQICGIQSAARRCGTRVWSHSGETWRSNTAALPATRMCTLGPAQCGPPKRPCKGVRTTARAKGQPMAGAAQAGKRAETRRHQLQQPRSHGEEHEEGARGITETRH